MKYTRTALAFVVGAIAAASWGQTGQGAMTTGDLHQICTAPDDESKAACRFYVLGVTQGIAGIRRRSHRPYVRVLKRAQSATPATEIIR